MFKKFLAAIIVSWSSCITLQVQATQSLPDTEQFKIQQAWSHCKQIPTVGAYYKSHKSELKELIEQKSPKTYEILGKLVTEAIDQFDFHEATLTYERDFFDIPLQLIWTYKDKRNSIGIPIKNPDLLKWVHPKAPSATEINAGKKPGMPQNLTTQAATQQQNNYWIGKPMFFAATIVAAWAVWMALPALHAYWGSSA